MTIPTRIHDIIRKVIKHPQVTAVDSNMDLKRDLRADSLDCMCISIELEQEFGIEFRDAELLTSESVGDIEALVLGKLNERIAA